jgi:hypothetical protein
VLFKLRISDAVGSILGVVPSHFTLTAYEFIDDMSLAAPGANQRFARMDP